MKPTLLIKEREETISEKQDSIIEIDKKSKLAIFPEKISVEPLDKIDKVTQQNQSLFIFKNLNFQY